MYSNTETAKVLVNNDHRMKEKLKIQGPYNGRVGWEDYFRLQSIRPSELLQW